MTVTRLTTLLVDARPLDHPTARQRGIGRYVTGLLTGLRDIGAPAIALYGTNAEAEVLADTVPGIACRKWSPQVVRDHAVPGTWYLATQLMLHPIPLDPIPRCVTDARLPVAAVMYDVIPYRYSETYFADPNARIQAGLRAPLTRTVDVLLAISDFSGRTAAEELAYPRERIATIGAGVGAQFVPASGDPRARSGRVIPDGVGAYVVAVGGGDEHKNVAGLLSAWAHVDSALSYHLVIAGAHRPEVLRRWERWATEAGVVDRVVFTGGVVDDELVAVFQGAALAVMPSLEEGFGLPVLEAAACGVPVITSNVSSLPEVLDEPDACFDPHDPRAIADAIERALTDAAHRGVLLSAGARATDRWTWANVATATIRSLDTLGPRWRQHVRPAAPRVAIVGALAPADPSGAADTTARIAAVTTDVVEALRARATDVTTMVDRGASPAPTGHVSAMWPARALGRYVPPWDFDDIVAVLGAAPDHQATGTLARDVPCHVWVHDAGMIGVRFGANLHALEIARSAIVHSDDAAARLRRAAERPCPILVLDVDLSPGEKASALGDWLADVGDLDPSTIRHALSPVASPDP